MDSPLAVGEGGGRSLSSMQPSSSRPRHYHNLIALLLTMNVECLRLVNRDIGDRREGDHVFGSLSVRTESALYVGCKTTLDIESVST